MIVDLYGPPPLAVLTVSGSPASSTVVATLDGTSVTGVYDAGAGTFSLVLPCPGDWVVTSTDNGLSASATVSVTAPGPYELALTPPTVPIGKEYFFTSGTTWTCPQTGLYTIEVHGGGGGGGGGQRVSTTISRPGGDGGGSGARGYNVRLEEGQTYQVTIGRGGSGGSLNANGSTGGTSSFGSLVTVYGGNGGVSGGSDGKAGSVSGSGFTNVGNAGGTGGGSYPSYGAGGNGGSTGGSGSKGSDGCVSLTLTAYA